MPNFFMVSGHYLFNLLCQASSENRLFSIIACFSELTSYTSVLLIVWHLEFFLRGDGKEGEIRENRWMGEFVAELFNHSNTRIFFMKAVQK